jgi:L-2-hydroxyglutarate oxidase
MNFDVVIIGGGIVGLATALKTKELNPSLKICLLEKENQLASHQTGNNSGVIHSGIYYKPGSLKAGNCLRGYQYLIDFCQTHNIPFELNGKIIVATHPKELVGLENLYTRGNANGLSKITKLGKEQLINMSLMLPE